MIYTERELLYGAPVCPTSGQITLDSWAMEMRWFLPIGRIAYVDIVKKHEANITRLNGARTADGLLHSDAVCKILLAECYEKQTFETRLRRTFVTERGQQFLEAYDRWDSGHADAEEVKQRAFDYLSHGSELAEISLSEFFARTNGKRRECRF